MRQFFGPKMCSSNPFLLPKDHIQEKFHHYLYHYFIKHITAFYVKMTEIAHFEKYIVSMVFRYYRFDWLSMRFIVLLTTFTNTSLRHHLNIHYNMT